MTAADLSEVAGFDIRVDGTAWEISPNELVAGTSPGLLRVAYIARRDAPEHDLRFLSSWRGLGDDADPAVHRELERLLGSGDPDLSQFLYASQLSFLCAPDEDLLELVRHGLLESLDRSFPDPRTVFVDYDTRVHARTAFVRSLLAAHHAVDWMNWSPERGLGALSGFTGGVLMGNTTVVDPLLASAFPWLFGMSLTRVGAGLAVALFGRVVPWRPNLVDQDLGEMLLTSHLVAGPVVRAPTTPTIDVNDAVAAVRWWVERADQVLGVLTDPTLYGADGIYDPRTHAAAIANVERLFASVIALLGHTGRDEYSRQLHLFETLDILEGLGLGGYDQTLSPTSCRHVLDVLEEQLPAPVARVLLPRCVSALDALDVVARSFITERTTPAGIRIDTANGAQVFTRDRATSMLLRQVRNAGHGLESALRDPYKLSVLTSHDGTIPSPVSDVAFLHFLSLLADPTKLEARLARRAGT